MGFTGYFWAIAIPSWIVFLAIYFALARLLASRKRDNIQTEAAPKLEPPASAAADVLQRPVLPTGISSLWIVRAGQLVALMLICGSVTASGILGNSLVSDMVRVALYGAVALVLMALSGQIGARALVLGRLKSEVAKGNSAAAIAGAAHFIATGVIISRCVHGDDIRSIGLSVVFFVIGQTTLHLFILLFRLVTSYSDAEEILQGNIAASLSYAGVSIAISLIIGRALEGDFVDWISSIKGYGQSLIVALLLYPVRQIIVQTIIMGSRPSFYKGAIDRCVAHERNTGVAALEASAYIATALFLGRI